MNMETNPQGKQTQFFLFACVGLLFLVLYFILAYFNRPAADDFYFLAATRDQGIFPMTWTAYTTWITRWTVLPFTGFVMQVTGGKFLLFHAVTLLFLWAALYMNFRKLLPGSGFATLLLFSLFLLLMLFQFSPATGESFWWATSVCMYLWPCIVLMALIPLLRTQLLSGKIILTLGFLFIGGGSEVVALESLLLIPVLLAFRSRWPAIEKSFTPGNLWIAASCLVIALTIAWLGHGRAARQEALPSLSVLPWTWLAVQSAVYYLLIQVPVKMHWLFFMTLPWIVLRRFIQPGNSMAAPVVFRTVAKYCFVFASAVLLHFLLTTALLHSFPPARTSITLTIGLAVLCALSGWQLGALSWPPNALRTIPFLFAVACGILLIHGITTQSGKAKAYAHAWDERMLLLKKSATAESSLPLHPLPEAGMLYSAEISTDSTHFTNRQLRDYLDLKRAPVRSND